MGAAAAALASVYVLSTLPTPLYTEYRRVFGFSQIVLTVTYSVYVVGSLATMFLLGRLSDQVGRRPVVLTSLGLAVLATLLFLVASGTACLFVARVVSGFGVALASGACTAWIVELHPRSEGSRASQIAIGANLFGLGAGALMSGLLVQYAVSPLRLVYLLYLASIPIVCAAVWYCRETVEQRVPLRKAALRPRFGVPREQLGAFAFPAVSAFATFSVLGFCTALPPSLLMQSFGNHNHAHAGAIVGGLFFTGALVVATTRSVRARPGTLTGLALLVPGTALLVIAQALASVPLLLAGTALAGGGGGLGYRFGVQVVNEIAPEDRRAEMVSSYLIVCYVAISLPVVGIDLLAGATSFFAADVVFGGLIFLVAIAAFVIVHRSPRSSLRPWSERPPAAGPRARRCRVRVSWRLPR